MKFRKRPVIVEANQWFQNGDHPDDYEDMDWEDDEPEEDSAGFTKEDRCPKYDSDHETE